MKREFLLLIVSFLSLGLCSPFVSGPQASSTARGSTTAQTAEVKPAPKPTPSPAKRPETNAESSAQGAKAEPSVGELIAQGKSLYRLAKFKQALAKFEAALKREPINDEALGLAAVTAFRLDSQVQSRDYFLRRADLASQKDSVKAYCYYRVALTYWRDAHDLVAKYGDIEDGMLVYNLPDRAASDAGYNIKQGLEYVNKALAITKNFAEAFNVKNLLHAEAALAAADEERAAEHQKLSLEALRRAIEISETSAGGKRGDAADFSQPTIRVAQYAKTKEEEDKLDDPIMKMIEGGRPIRRIQPILPSQRQSKETNDPQARGGASESGPSTAGTVKIEVLISTTGEVVFAHIVDGRSDLNGAAIVAARSWKFDPAKFEGKPVQVSGMITFEIKPKK